MPLGDMVLILIPAMLFLWAGILFIVPSYMRSLFRYRLWEIRDRAVDDLRAGRLADCYTVREFISMVEFAIRYANRMTLLEVIVTPPLPRPWAEARENGRRADLAEMSDDSRFRFERCAVGFSHALLRHVLGGSLTGWVVAVVGTVCRLGESQERIVDKERISTIIQSTGDPQYDRRELIACT